MVLSPVAVWKSSREMLTCAACGRMISVTVEGLTAWLLGAVVEEVLYRISGTWFPHVEKCEFSGPALDLMTHASETD